MKICDCSDCEVFETTRMDGQNEVYTGKYRVRVPCDDDVIAFDLPGRGGAVTIAAAKSIHKLWHSGMKAGEIMLATGCQIAR